MTAQVERAALVAALTQATKAVETRTTIPVLANAWLEVSGGRLAVRATDLDVEISTGVPADGSLEPVTAPARTLLDVAKRQPDGATIDLAMDGDRLIVKCGRSRSKLPTLPANDFPSLSAAGFSVEMRLDLAALLSPVAFAISTEETRYYLNGVFLHAVDGRLRAVATDGHRLAAVYGPECADVPAIIVPRKTVGLIPDGEIDLAVSDSRIRFTKGETVITSKLVEGTFPDYDRVIPKNNDKQVVLERGVLLAAIDRVGVFASERGGKVVRWDVAPGGVTLTTENPESGQSVDEVAAGYEGPPFVGGFNVGYVAEQLRAAGGAEVEFMFGDGGPVLITSGNPDWVSVLMPMRVAAA